MLSYVSCELQKMSRKLDQNICFHMWKTGDCFIHAGEQDLGTANQHLPWKALKSHCLSKSSSASSTYIFLSRDICILPVLCPSRTSNIINMPAVCFLTFSCLILTLSQTFCGHFTEGTVFKTFQKMSLAADSDISILTYSPFGQFQQNVRTSVQVWKQL